LPCVIFLLQVSDVPYTVEFWLIWNLQPFLTFHSEELKGEPYFCAIELEDKLQMQVTNEMFSFFGSCFHYRTKLIRKIQIEWFNEFNLIFKISLQMHRNINRVSHYEKMMEISNHLQWFLKPNWNWLVWENDNWQFICSMNDEKPNNTKQKVYIRIKCQLICVHWGIVWPANSSKWFNLKSTFEK